MESAFTHWANLEAARDDRHDLQAWLGNNLEYKRPLKIVSVFLILLGFLEDPLH